MAKYNDNKSQTDELERARATPLKPLVWMTGVLVWATVVGLFLRVPTWAGVFLCTITGISFLMFLIGYLYLFTNKREELRAERWRRGKDAISNVSSDEPLALNESQEMYLGLEPSHFSLKHEDEQELRFRVGEAGQGKVE